VTVTTYGDLVRVPGSVSSLEKEKAGGCDVRMVYSVLEALDLAEKNRDRKVVFLGIGFETTAPATALALIQAGKMNLENFFVLSSHKVMPPVMKALVTDGIKINGFLAPGHVSAITGSAMYEPIAGKFHIPVVISGFEPVDILQSVLMLVRQIENKRSEVEIQYTRVVKPEGNLAAQKVLAEVFTAKDDWWRGFGVIPKSGLKIGNAFRKFDAEDHFSIHIPIPEEPKGCICGELLKGLKTPFDCRLFGKVCRPNNPIGACMVSQEGICAAYYRYER
jgi:hydrogenase expression/formation protein HypD